MTFTTHTTLSRSVAAGGNYTAGDVVSNSETNGAGTPWVFNNVGERGTITDSVMTCSEDAVVWRTRLHLFNAEPTASEMDDNAAFSLGAADQSKYIGYLDSPAAADLGDISISQASNLKGYYCPGGKLYGLLQTLDGEANETAGMTIEITLWVTR